MASSANAAATSTALPTLTEHATPGSPVADLTIKELADEIKSATAAEAPPVVVERKPSGASERSARSKTSVESGRSEATAAAASTTSGESAQLSTPSQIHISEHITLTPATPTVASEPQSEEPTVVATATSDLSPRSSPTVAAASESPTVASEPSDDHDQLPSRSPPQRDEPTSPRSSPKLDKNHRSRDIASTATTTAAAAVASAAAAAAAPTSEDIDATTERSRPSSSGVEKRIETSTSTRQFSNVAESPKVAHMAETRPSAAAITTPSESQTSADDATSNATEKSASPSPSAPSLVSDTRHSVLQPDTSISTVVDPQAAAVQSAEAMPPASTGEQEEATSVNVVSHESRSSKSTSSPQRRSPTPVETIVESAPPPPAAHAADVEQVDAAPENFGPADLSTQLEEAFERAPANGAVHSRVAVPERAQHSTTLVNAPADFSRQDVHFEARETRNDSGVHEFIVESIATEPEHTVESDRVTEPERIAEPEHAAEPERIAEREHVAKPEHTAEPERIAEPEHAAEPERMAEQSPPRTPTPDATPTDSVRPLPTDAPDHHRPASASSTAASSAAESSATTSERHASPVRVESPKSVELPKSAESPIAAASSAASQKSSRPESEQKSAESKPRSPSPSAAANNQAATAEQREPNEETNERRSQPATSPRHTPPASPFAASPFAASPLAASPLAASTPASPAFSPDEERGPSAPAMIVGALAAGIKGAYEKMAEVTEALVTPAVDRSPPPLVEREASPPPPPPRPASPAFGVSQSEEANAQEAPNHEDQLSTPVTPVDEPQPILEFENLDSNRAASTPQKDAASEVPPFDKPTLVAAQQEPQVDRKEQIAGSPSPPPPSPPLPPPQQVERAPSPPPTPRDEAPRMSPLDGDEVQNAPLDAKATDERRESDELVASSSVEPSAPFASKMAEASDFRVDESAMASPARQASPTLIENVEVVERTSPPQVESTTSESVEHSATHTSEFAPPRAADEPLDVDSQPTVQHKPDEEKPATSRSSSSKAGSPETAAIEIVESQPVNDRLHTTSSGSIELVESEPIDSSLVDLGTTLADEAELQRVRSPKREPSTSSQLVESSQMASPPPQNLPLESEPAVSPAASDEQQDPLENRRQSNESADPTAQASRTESSAPLREASARVSRSPSVTPDDLTEYDSAAIAEEQQARIESVEPVDPLQPTFNEQEDARSDDDRHPIAQASDQQASDPGKEERLVESLPVFDSDRSATTPTTPPLSPATSPRSRTLHLESHEHELPAASSPLAESSPPAESSPVKSSPSDERESKPGNGMMIAGGFALGAKAAFDKAAHLLTDKTPEEAAVEPPTPFEQQQRRPDVDVESSQASQASQESSIDETRATAASPSAALVDSAAHSSRASSAATANLSEPSAQNVDFDQAAEEQSSEFSAPRDEHDAKRELIESSPIVETKMTRSHENADLSSRARASPADAASSHDSAATRGETVESDDVDVASRNDVLPYVDPRQADDQKADVDQSAAVYAQPATPPSSAHTASSSDLIDFAKTLRDRDAEEIGQSEVRLPSPVDVDVAEESNNRQHQDANLPASDLKSLERKFELETSAFRPSHASGVSVQPSGEPGPQLESQLEPQPEFAEESSPSSPVEQPPQESRDHKVEIEISDFRPSPVSSASMQPSDESERQLEAAEEPSPTSTAEQPPRPRSSEVIDPASPPTSPQDQQFGSQPQTDELKAAGESLAHDLEKPVVVTEEIFTAPIPHVEQAASAPQADESMTIELRLTAITAEGGGADEADGHRNFVEEIRTESGKPTTVEEPARLGESPPASLATEDADERAFESTSEPSAAHETAPPPPPMASVTATSDALPIVPIGVGHDTASNESLAGSSTHESIEEMRPAADEPRPPTPPATGATDHSSPGFDHDDDEVEILDDEAAAYLKVSDDEAPVIVETETRSESPEKTIDDDEQQQPSLDEPQAPLDDYELLAHDELIEIELDDRADERNEKRASGDGAASDAASDAATEEALQSSARLSQRSKSPPPEELSPARSESTARSESPTNLVSLETPPPTVEITSVQSGAPVVETSSPSPPPPPGAREERKAPVESEDDDFELIERSQLDEIDEDIALPHTSAPTAGDAPPTLNVAPIAARPHSPVPPRFQPSFDDAAPQAAATRATSEPPVGGASISDSTGSSTTNDSVIFVPPSPPAAATVVAEEANVQHSNDGSESSLLEFERLEAESAQPTIAVAPHTTTITTTITTTTITRVEPTNGLSTAPTIEDEVAEMVVSQTGSLNSLAEFEHLEREVLEEQIATAASIGGVDAMMLSDIREEMEADDDPSDSLEAPLPPPSAGAGVEAMITSSDSLEPLAVDTAIVTLDEPSAGELHMMETSIDSLEGGRSAAAAVGALVVGGGGGDEADRDSIEGDDYSVTTYETVQTAPDGSTATITRRVLTRDSNPIHSHVRFTGTEDAARLHHIETDERVESLDAEGNVTTTIMRRTPTLQ